MPFLTRREFIRTGIAGSLVLAAGGCARSLVHGPALRDRAYAYRFLSESDRAMIAAIAGVMLAGTDAVPVAVVRGVDVAIDGLPPGVQAEIRQLFGLLEFPVTRALAAGVWSAWDAAAPQQIAGFLTRWRYSGIALFRSGYQALHQLVMASWYGNAASWPRIGYPGPPRVA